MSEGTHIAFSAAVLGTPNACDFLRGFFPFSVTSTSPSSLSEISEFDMIMIWSPPDDGKRKTVPQNR
jgi:hypothetical protein